MMLKIIMLLYLLFLNSYDNDVNLSQFIECFNRKFQMLNKYLIEFTVFP